ncbi:hypothetical protein IFM89_022284 [Coptis chinensis]|uniref:Phytocyanin domain-containing protein n=1 Tax=Coptis chinensis TaxID=261450 RepID=A0A835IEJ1_9MAGN|nr:hypothetical protein IFM89_022284 [Coptis chinensis]
MIVFKYLGGAHNVHEVNGTGFQSCIFPAGSEASSKPLTTENDVITLATPGRKWYICSVGKHCEIGGQKLAITVLSGQWGPPAPAPSPSPFNSAKVITTPLFEVLMTAAITMGILLIA